MNENKNLLEFSENLKLLRKKKYLTGAELAKQLNVSHSALASWETGRHFPHIEDIIKIADFFEISIDELLGRNQTNFENITLKNSHHNTNNFITEFYKTLSENSDFTENDLKEILLIFDFIKLRNKKKK